MSAVSRPGRPAATTTMSAPRVCAARSLVPVWHSVTVAFSLRRVSSRPSDAAHGDAAADRRSRRRPRSGRHTGAAVRRCRAGCTAAGRLAEYQLAEIDRLQPVGVLGRVDQVQHRLRVQAGRQRQLDDVAGAGRIRVQLGDGILDLLLGGIRGQVPADADDPDLGAVPVLAVDVGAAAGIIADQDGAEAGRDARLAPALATPGRSGRRG